LKTGEATIFPETHRNPTQTEKLAPESDLAAKETSQSKPKLCSLIENEENPTEAEQKEDTAVEVLGVKRRRPGKKLNKELCQLQTWE